MAMKQRACCTNLGGDGLHRLDNAGLVVDLLDGDQAWLLVQRIVQSSHIDQAVSVDAQGPCRFAHRCRNDIVLGGAIGSSADPRPRADDRDRLAGAAGEDDVMTPAQHVRQGLPRLFQRLARFPAFTVWRRRICPNIQCPTHRFPGFGKDRRGRRMV
jgi:hypothetical protein